MKVGAVGPKPPARVMTCTVLYTVKCVRFDHGHLSTPELSDIAWNHTVGGRMKNVLATVAKTSEKF